MPDTKNHNQTFVQEKDSNTNSGAAFGQDDNAQMTKAMGWLRLGGEKKVRPPGLTALQFAASSGDYNKMNAVLRKGGVDVNETDAQGFSALHLAAQNGHTKIVKTLVLGANINACNKFGCTALHLAAQNGHLDSVVVLSNFYADLNLKNNDGDTALHLAAQKGYVDIVDAFIKAGAQLSVLNHNKNTALTLAALKGHTEVVSSLVNSGVDVDELKGHYTPLMRATQGGHLGTVQELLRLGAKVDQMTAHGEVALVIAAENGFTDVLIVLLLRSRYVRHSAASPLKTYVLNALCAAAKNGHSKAVNFIASLFQRQIEYNQPLMVATENNHIETVNVLVRLGADVNYQDLNGKTALHVATKNANPDMVEALLALGADVHLTEGIPSKNIKGKKKEDSDQLELKKAFDYDTALHMAIKNYGNATTNAHLAIIKSLLKAGAFVNMVNARGTAPIHLAAHYGDNEALKVLIQAGADVNWRNGNGFSALHISVENQHIATTNLLLENGARVNQPSPDGSTPLHLAAAKGNTTLLVLLINAGADVNIQNQKKNTALHLAAQAGHTTSVELLINSGANVNLENTNRQFPIHLVNDNPRLKEKNKRGLILALTELAESYHINYENDLSANKVYRVTSLEGHAGESFSDSKRPYDSELKNASKKSKRT